MRTAAFLMVLLIQAVSAQGDVVFFTGVPAPSESISFMEHACQGIQEDPYESREREIMVKLIHSILLSAECEVKRVDDLFLGMDVKTSV